MCKIRVLCFVTAMAAVFFVGGARADYSPFTGDNNNQIAIYAAQGVNNGFLIPPPFQLVPFYFLQLQYSQPTTFFRFPSRQSINFGQTLGFGRKYGWEWQKFTIPMVFLTEDIALLHGRRWYVSVGAGGGLQAQQNDRINTKWLFEFRVAGAYRVTENIGIEVYTQHFSNGNTGTENHSYGFYGMGVTYSF